MSSIEVSSEGTTRIHERGTVEMKLEVAVVPVSDVDRARVAH
jgi:hypothetical protein